MRYLVVFFLVGCSAVTEPELPTVSPLTPTAIQQLQTTLGSGPENLGWIDYQNSLQVSDSFCFTPVEAEDELRFLVYRPDQAKILALGLAEPTWWSAEYAKNSPVYDGWIFIYDLDSGDRLLSLLFEGGSLQTKEVRYKPNLPDYDLLASSEIFSELVLHLSHPPTQLKTSIFLADRESMLLQLTQELEPLKKNF